MNQAVDLIFIETRDTNFRKARERPEATNKRLIEIEFFQ